MPSCKLDRTIHTPLAETPAFLAVAGLFCLCAAYLGSRSPKFISLRNVQAAEIAIYILSAITIPGTAVYLCATRRSRRERRRVHPPLVMSPAWTKG